jgi:hypothetical protein
MHSRLGHIRPILREVGRYGQRLTWFVCTFQLYRWQLYFKLVLVNKEHHIKNKKYWLGLHGTDLKASTAKKIVEKLEMRSSADLDLPKTLSATTNRILKIIIWVDCAKNGQFDTIYFSSYHPCPNRVERTNADLVRMKESYLSDCNGKWDFHIHNFVLVLRSMIKDTTQVSPAFINFGRVNCQ